MKTTLIKNITPEIRLEEYQGIYFIRVQHRLGSALISLQGAQLLQWRPTASIHDVLWVSEIENYQKGDAIRGGVPICYPWFGGVKSPSHGTARIRNWQLSAFFVDLNQVELEFSLFDEYQIIEAQLKMTFKEDCTLLFTHLGAEEAQLAFHTYFQVGEIEAIEVAGLPTQFYSALTKEELTVPSPRTIHYTVDGHYSVQSPNWIEDKALQRTIEVEHLNASEIVLWNPWEKPTSKMSADAFRKMVCLETARIKQKIQTGEQVGVIFRVK